MNKRDASKLKSGDLVTAHDAGIYEPTAIKGIVLTDSDYHPDTFPLFQLKGQPESRLITYRLLKLVTA